MSDPGSSAPPIDNDPVYDGDLWSFSAFFPPPYRVLLLASIGLLLFAINVKVLQEKRIDLFTLFRADEAEKKRVPPPAGGFHRSTTGATTQYGSYHNVNPSSSSSASSASTISTLTSTPNQSILPTVRPYASSSLVTMLTTKPLFTFGLVQLIWSLLGWASYRFYVDSLQGDPRGRHAQALQGICVLGSFLALLWPGTLFFKPMRKSFGRSLLLILSPSLNQPVTFSDVVLADILTSFAKVLGDVWLTACFLVPRKEHHTWWNGKGSIAVPLLISLPYAVRFRQCLSEYFVSSSIDTSEGGGGVMMSKIRNKRPLWNALKYASAFPVIWLSAWYEADKNPVHHQQDGKEAQVGGRYLMWLLAVIVNSVFSFWWDITNDWGLSLLLPANMGSVSQMAQNAVHLHRRGLSYMPLPVSEEAHALPMNNMMLTQTPQEKPSLTSATIATQTVGSLAVAPNTNPSGGPASTSANVNANANGARQARHGRNLSTMERLLRPTPALMFSSWMYQVAIALDLLLRFFWSLKLSSHLHHLVEWQGGMFTMELLEILRRWVWVFFRVEWEVVRRRDVLKKSHHVAID